ncbi:rRNA maturation RNase YbeY [Brevibacterium sp. p3-SID960]|uniref:rRNA maturation RNase YbeY n=1 Tax=Brevibacterium sp. p3-SID960 TaxID=2916063 RepID=UPI0021A27740|nr:rRNA maturation RNase YbeY [Brevibacterium sp. p3-SID960]MCT1691294.1 rRNA maturation RNase YbeY [Brevibacterium sp. p3-SID960]
MAIDISNETPADIDLPEVVALAEHVLERMHINPAAEVFIRFIDEAAMTELHLRWMNLDGPTDVMSFPMDELKPGQDEAGMLGDIVICPGVAAEQAAAAGHSLSDEILLLTAHGLLHLMGYDHHEPEAKEEMFGLQRHLLLTWFAEREPGRTTIPEPTED